MQAYCNWKSRKEGVVWRLPTEPEWEKAARGVDGRAYPWGNRHDATLCLMAFSRPGHAFPEPVGAFPSDCSPYGVRDMAGGYRDRCALFEGLEGLHPNKGGSMVSGANSCRAFHATESQPWTVYSVVGFRMVRSLHPRDVGGEG